MALMQDRESEITGQNKREQDMSKHLVHTHLQFLTPEKTGIVPWAML